MAPAAAVTAPQQQQQQTPVVMAPQAQVHAASQPAQPPQTGMAAAAAPGATVVSQVGVSPSSLPFLAPTLCPRWSTTLSLLPAGGLRHECHSPQVTGGLNNSRSWTCIQSLTHAHMHFPVMLSHKCVAAPRTITGPEWSHTWSHTPLETLCVGEVEAGSIVDGCIP